LAKKITLGEGILRREQNAESQPTDSRRKILRREQTLGEAIFKNSHFHLQIFFVINMHLYKGYVQI
jgi:hypothetical protein